MRVQTGLAGRDSWLLSQWAVSVVGGIAISFVYIGGDVSPMGYIVNPAAIDAYRSRTFIVFRSSIALFGRCASRQGRVRLVCGGGCDTFRKIFGEDALWHTGFRCLRVTGSTVRLDGLRAYSLRGDQITE